MNNLRNNNFPLQVLWICIGLICSCQYIFGQDNTDSQTDEVRILEIGNKLLLFRDQLDKIADHVSQYSAEELDKADKQILTIDTKWNVYYQSKQNDIAENDSLLQIVSDYQLIKQNLSDSITVRKRFYEAQSAMDNAESFFSAQDSIYDGLYRTALEYSLVKSLGDKLEQIKQQEQVMFAEVQRQYENAKNSSTEFDCLLPRFQPIEEQYFGIKNISAKIQASEYKPWIQRIKDYLYGLAAVAMILMFINMLQAKLKTLKQARENAKKLRKMLNDEQNEYPSI